MCGIKRESIDLVALFLCKIVNMFPLSQRYNDTSLQRRGLSVIGHENKHYKQI